MIDPTVINTIVKYSKDCITMRFVKLRLKEDMFLVTRLPFPISSVNLIKVIINSIEIGLEEKEKVIGKLLIRLFEGKDFSYEKNGKWSLSKGEIRDTYILLKEVSKRDPITNQIISYKPDEYIILLKQYKEFEPGILYHIGLEFKEEFLSNIKPSNEELISNDLLNIIIKKSRAYEYIE
jgi:hypothetical protein